MMPPLKFLNLAPAVIFLASCALVGPNYERPPAELPTQFSESASNADAAGVPISNTWWELYNDPVLNDLVSKALRNNSDIKLAVARIEEADAFLREVGSALLPTVDLDSSASRSRASTIGPVPFPPGAKALRKDFEIKLGTSFEIDFWGKLRRAKEAARAQALSTRYARDTVNLSLAGLVSSNYLLLRSLDGQITLSRSTLVSREESLALTKRRAKGGIASDLDIQQAEVSRANLLAQIADLTQQRALTQHQLAVLSGDLNLKLAQGDIKQIPLPPVPPAGLPSTLLEARPDIRQAEQDMIAANAKIGIAKAALFPTISLTASFGAESGELGDILKSAARIWSGGVGLNLPIFDAGRLSSKVDQASAQQKQALASYEGSIQTAFREVNDALVKVRQGGEKEAALQIAQEAAGKSLQIAENRYKAGYSAYLDVLDAQRTYNEAALSYIQSRQVRLAATVELFKALGGGWTDQQVQPAS
jgi:multidrug efflux system outer membrane protein